MCIGGAKRRLLFAALACRGVLYIELPMVTEEKCCWHKPLEPGDLSAAGEAYALPPTWTGQTYDPSRPTEYPIRLPNTPAFYP